MSSTVKMHGDFQPNVFDPQKGPFLTWAHTHTCIFERLGSQILVHGVKYSWKKVGSSGIMHSADFQPNVFVDLLVVNYINFHVTFT